VSCFTDAEKNASLACASSLMERDCSTSMRKRFISMSSSFSSRRITGNGSGASQGWGPRNGLMMATSQHRLMSDSVSKRGLQLVNIGADARNFPRTRWTSASRGMGYTPGTALCTICIRYGICTSQQSALDLATGGMAKMAAPAHNGGSPAIDNFRLGAGNLIFEVPK